MNSPDHPLEKELLQRLQTGDYTAFEILYDRYKRRLASNLIRLLRSDELAQDALQELFLKVWSHRREIDPERPFRAYLFRMAENLVIDFYRRAARDKRMQEQLLAGSDGSYSHIEESLVSRERIALVRHIIDQLPPQQKKAYTLHKIEGRSYKEISDLMHISPSTINKHVHAAGKFVKQQLLNTPELAHSVIIALALSGI